MSSLLKKNDFSMSFAYLGPLTFDGPEQGFCSKNCQNVIAYSVFGLSRLKFTLYIGTPNPCPAELGYTLPLQTRVDPDLLASTV